MDIYLRKKPKKTVSADGGRGQRQNEKFRKGRSFPLCPSLRLIEVIFPNAYPSFSSTHCVVPAEKIKIKNFYKEKKL